MDEAAMMWVTGTPVREICGWGGGVSPFLPQESMELGCFCFVVCGFMLAIHLAVRSERSGAGGVLLPEVAYS